MKLIVISNSGKVENEAEIVKRLFENGLGTLHIRKPKLSTRELKEYIASIPRAYHPRIVIHSHHRLALAFPVKGIHITKSHKRRKFKTWFNVKWIRFKRPGILVTTSYSKLASLFEETFAYDYVFLSPVFDNLTSKYQSGFTEHSLKATFEKTPNRVIARGGTDINCLEKVKNIGFEGVAFYSSIWNKQDPVAEFTRIMERCRELGIATD